MSIGLLLQSQTIYQEVSSAKRRYQSFKSEAKQLVYVLVLENTQIKQKKKLLIFFSDRLYKCIGKIKKTKEKDKDNNLTPRDNWY